MKKNKGAPGIDGITIETFESNLDEELARLRKDLESWRYKPEPVRRVEIPKPGKGKGVRLLGVPCVRDRVVHAALKLLLEPIFDPTFSDHSYGFRPGYSPQKAVEAAKRIIRSGKDYVVDIDLSKFFDRVNHDRLIYLMSVLSNVVLDELDKELEKRGLEFCRYADDCNIFLRSPKTANRVMKSISRFIENKLKLKVNWDKSRVGRSQDVKFLGMTVIKGTIAISVESMRRARQKIRELTPRGTHLSIEKTVDRINSWYIGWSGYYYPIPVPVQSN